MARTPIQTYNGLVNDLVAYAASIGISINPNDWIIVPGNISQTDYKVLLLNTVATGISFEEQVQDLFTSQNETLITSAAPQTLAWFQYQMLMFQYDATVLQIPQIQPSTSTKPLAIIWNPVVPSYRVIGFCIAQFGSAGRCLIKCAANSGGLPVPLSEPELAAATSFLNFCAAPGISYVLSSDYSDWLYLQLNVYYIGAYSSVIFANVSAAITAFLNSLSTTAFSNNLNATMKLSALESAILAVEGVDDMEFINVFARPDVAYSGSTATTWGTVYQQKLVLDTDEQQRLFTSIAGYISVENGTSTGGTIPYSQLGDARSATDSTLNLNCIAV